MSEPLLKSPGRVDERGFIHQTLNFRANTFAEVFTVAPLIWEGIPQRKGGLSWDKTADGRYAVQQVYSGLLDEPGDPEAEENFEILPTRSEEAIETHPQIQRLISEYNGTIDPQTRKITFPRVIGAASGDALGDPLSLDTYRTGASVGPNAEANPMFGRESWLQKGRIVRWRYASRSYPYSWEEKDGTVVAKAPGPSRTPPGQDWLVMFGPVRSYGTGSTLGWDVQIDFLLSPPGIKWPPSYAVFGT